MAKKASLAAAAAIVLLGIAPSYGADNEADIVRACTEHVAKGLRPLAADRADRFLGKVDEAAARCRGGEKAVRELDRPWVDWANYWATGDAASESDVPVLGTLRNKRGVDGALLDLEYQRMELIRFNLFDNRTYEQYMTGRMVDGKLRPGPLLTQWPEFQLAIDDPSYGELRVRPDGQRECQGRLIRFRTRTGICNDVVNPAMGSSGQQFARNVAFESTFPDLGKDPRSAARHGGRLSLLKPDPQVISRKLFSRDAAGENACNEGRGDGRSPSAACPYRAASFFNVMAAFWIQFMTHDWFSHMVEGRNDPSRIMTSLGCARQRDGGVERPLTPGEIARLGCRPEDRIDAALFDLDADPGTFRDQQSGRDRLQRSYKTSRNQVTAWWDTSQIYGYDERSARRVRRDPADRARLLMEPVGARPGAGERQGYLPLFRTPCAADQADANCDPINPEWVGQESAAFPDNWSIGISFLHNVFAREHNLIVDALRRRAREKPDEDSGLRDPSQPSRVITYAALSDEELFQVARLVVAAEIAKIHTIEWTTQLLYGRPLHLGMNSNWTGLLDDKGLTLAAAALGQVVSLLRKSDDPVLGNQLFSAFAAGPGIVGLGNKSAPAGLHLDAQHRWHGPDVWDITRTDHVNGGTNHFGSPFNFPEEFVTVYRLHPLVPDLLELRDWSNDANKIRQKVPVVATFRGEATPAMRDAGLASWAISMGRQRLGALSLNNHPRFLQALDLRPRIDSKIDVAALDLIRDREHGVPRFNEFRRQLGLRHLTSFDDFIDHRPGASPSDVADQRRLAATLREVYGQHKCDRTKLISWVPVGRDANGRPIEVDDCLGHPNGTIVDNVEDVDVVVGWLAESTRPHGFAISETQFHVFILNASRRLFSDRFFTSSFRPEFYTYLGVQWVEENGDQGRVIEPLASNGDSGREMLPLKRVLLRVMPELEPELRHVVNSFDPWARDRGEYYSLAWKPRADATGDDAFRQP